MSTGKERPKAMILSDSDGVSKESMRGCLSSYPSHSGHDIRSFPKLVEGSDTTSVNQCRPKTPPNVFLRLRIVLLSKVVMPIASKSSLVMQRRQANLMSILDIKIARSDLANRRP